MSIQQVVNERTGAQLTVNFYDVDGTPEIPDSLLYRIDCTEPRQEIVDWAVLSPALEVVIDITSDQNAIINRRKGFETHKVTVKAGYNGDTEFAYDVYLFKVRNLQFVS